MKRDIYKKKKKKKKKNCLVSHVYRGSSTPYSSRKSVGTSSKTLWLKFNASHSQILKVIDSKYTL